MQESNLQHTNLESRCSAFELTEQVSYYTIVLLVAWNRTSKDVITRAQPTKYVIHHQKDTVITRQRNRRITPSTIHKNSAAKLSVSLFIAVS